MNASGVRLEPPEGQTDACSRRTRLELYSDRTMRCYLRDPGGTNVARCPEGGGLQRIPPDHSSELGDAGGSENPVRVRLRVIPPSDGTGQSQVLAGDLLQMPRANASR
jgi:hypothetical protein